MESSSPLIGIGAGGHASVLVEALRLLGDYEIVGLISEDPSAAGSSVLGIPVLGGEDRLPGLLAEGVRAAFIGVGGVRDNAPRRRLFERVLGLGFDMVSVTHPRAFVSASAVVRGGAQILAGAFVNARARLGANVIVNSGAIVEHDCRVADHVHVATGARLCGGVTVGEAAHVGAGSTTIQGVTIGPRSIVGAGAVVVEDVPADGIVAGVPARSIRPE